MAKPSSPSEIAREALLRLAQRRLPPTPDNYRTIYQEISGVDVDSGESFQEKPLKNIAYALPRSSPEQLRFARQFEEAVSARSWNALAGAINDLAAKVGSSSLQWSGLIRNLLTQLDNRSLGLTAAKKRETLEHVLNASSNPDLLFQRLQSLLKSWSSSPLQGGESVLSGDAVAVSGSPEAVAPAAEVATPDHAAFPPETGLRELAAQLLQNAIAALLVDEPEVVAEAQALATEIRAVQTPEQVAQLTAKVKKFSYRLNYVAEDQSEIRAALQKLLCLVTDNIGELVIDDKWLHGQVAVVSELISQQPLNLRQLDNVESRLRDLIVKQSALKQNLTKAQEHLKTMLATFVDRLADFSESTSDYHGKIEKCAERITQADTIGQLSEVLDEVMRETRGIQMNTLRSHTELAAMRRQVDEAEREIGRLQAELAQASELVRHDPLTGALNRKGMDEAVEREVSRCRRHGGPLSVALLDIDNFKMLNDKLGHAAGDFALIHLATVVRDTIRPQDTLARYGGEEFIILLPDTSLDDATNVMVRVQRELTRKFFLHNHEKILITFSCGVAELGANEAAEDAINRSDGAMYLAKRMGKNRVVAG